MGVDADADGAQVDGFHLFRIVEVAAFKAELQKGPETRCLAGVVVAVVVDVAFEQPAPGPALAPLLGFFFPPLEDAAHAVEGLLPVFGIADQETTFVGVFFPGYAAETGDRFEDAMFERRRPPGRP